MRRWGWILGGLVLAGCVTETVKEGPSPTDQGVQSDGSQAEDAATRCPPGEPEDACGVCGGDGPGVWFADQDRDGQGDRRIEVRACERPVGFVANGDDTEPDCATNDTDECGVCGGRGLGTFFADADGDGLGDDDNRVVACGPPQGYLPVGGDPEPDCATNDSDACGVCAGPGEARFWLDADGDGLGDPAVPADACDPIDGFVANDQDPEPDCATNDTDACGACGGPGPVTLYADGDGDGLGDPAEPVDVCGEDRDGLVDNADDAEPACATNDTDDCGDCGGGNARQDCHGVCDGEAAVDACSQCTGGQTGVEPAPEDDADGDGIPDVCDECPQTPPARFIVQWDAVPPFQRNGEPHGPYTFQAVLYQNGHVRFQYRQMAPFGATATVGYQIDADTAVTLSRDNDFVLDQPVVTLTPRDGRLEADYVAPMDWMDIREIGEPLNLGDDAQVEREIGFPFPLQGERFETVRVSSNGMLVFEGNMPGFNNGPLPIEGTGRALFPFWDDLNPGAGGQIYVHTAVPACEDDCHGDLGGYAFLDGCGECVGGNTGRVPSDNLDCAGSCNGEAFIDQCGQCVGGVTGRQAADDCRPDLIVDGAYLAQTLQLDELDAQDECLINERCVGALGLRKILRFGTRIANVGTADLRLGAPREGVDHWIFDQCHQHFHFDAYAAYQLYDVANDRLLDIGAKAGFSVIDIGVWDRDLAPNGCRGYNGQDQGISAGCQDTYARSLRCQWIDITDVAPGDYEVVVTTNPDGVIEETDLENNSARVRVRIAEDSVELLGDP
ncbi:MAG: hypothetical protein H6702_12760 [Myxococcales bacterium]|nr:hypothetical protein [Myxococcales bacterium]